MKMNDDAVTKAKINNADIATILQYLNLDIVQLDLNKIYRIVDSDYNSKAVFGIPVDSTAQTMTFTEKDNYRYFLSTLSGLKIPEPIIICKWYSANFEYNGQMLYTSEVDRVKEATKAEILLYAPAYIKETYRNRKTA